MGGVHAVTYLPSYVSSATSEANVKYDKIDMSCTFQPIDIELSRAFEELSVLKPSPFWAKG